MRNHAIITAAGKGSRFGGNKALHLLSGKPLLVWSLEIFSKLVDEIVVTYPEGDQRQFSEVVSTFHNVKLISGGETRFRSVRKGFESLNANGVVLIHDAARPLVSNSLVERILHSATEKGAVIPVLPVSDTVKEVEKDRIVRTIARDRLMLAQTPQGFHSSILAEAYSRVQNQDVTDEAMLAELAGIEVFCIPGEVANLKITEHSDITLAEFYLRKEGR
jgi:2-C-methyl-D-erythritol 4-phosphate cytidylyltransferase/2-C-methyl-D-erythritol 2,4-cyclodiphosphate synthase